MRMTVLGKSPAWADAGGACSGYLVDSGDTSVLLDCGPGVLGKLRALRDYASVDAVVLSHMHADHILDLVPYASALLYSERWADGHAPRPRPALHAPPGGRDALARVCAGAGMFGSHVQDAFDVHEYDPDGTLRLGPLSLRFQLVPHFVPAHAVELADESGRMTFSSDCGPNADLPAFARDTDLLLIEATLSEAFAGDGGPERGHLTPREAGEAGRTAGAHRLVLTHFSDELDLATARAQAADAFGQAVEVAAEGAVFTL